MFSWLLVLYFILFIILSIKNFKWAVLAVVGFSPSYLIRFEVLGLPITVLEGMILVVFVASLKQLSTKALKHLNTKALKHLNTEALKHLNFKALRRFFDSLRKGDVFLCLNVFVFLCSATAAMFAGPDLRAAAGLWKAYFVEPILFLLVFVNVIKKKDLEKVWGVLGVTVLLLSLVAVYQKVTGNLIPNEFWTNEATRRVTGVYPYPNALALFVSPVVVMVVGYLAQRIKKPRNQEIKKSGLKWLDGWMAGWLGVVVILGLISIWFTRSKGAMAGVAAGLIFYALFYPGARKYFLGILGLGVIIAGFYLFNSNFSLEGNYTVEGGGSLTTRIEMWQETGQMLKNRPILGAGLGGYQTVVGAWHEKDYIEIYLYPHNVILNFWSEIGFIGLVGFMGLIGWFYWFGFKKLKDIGYRILDIDFEYSCSVVFMAGMTALLAHGLVDAPYFKNDLSLLFWVVVGGMIVLSKERNEI